MRRRDVLRGISFLLALSWNCHNPRKWEGIAKKGENKKGKWGGGATHFDPKNKQKRKGENPKITEAKTAPKTPATDTSAEVPPALTITAKVPEGEVTKVTVGDKDIPVGTNPGDATVTDNDDGTVTITVPNQGEVKNGTPVTVTTKADGKAETTSPEGHITVDPSKAEETLKNVPGDLDPSNPKDKAVIDAKKELEKKLQDPKRTQKDVDDATKKLQDALKDKGETNKDGLKDSIAPTSSGIPMAPSVLKAASPAPKPQR